jgi:ribonuclease PH
MRPSGRAADQLRPVSLEIDVNKHAEGSCLARFGDTHVLCTASIEDGVPPWLRNTGRGWVTAEYGMLPRATTTRTGREAARGKQSGRTQEIQRLIGRSLRAVTNLSGFGERQIKVDCDVIQADGGTRTAAITGGYVALYQAFQHMLDIGALAAIPFTDQVAGVSCGIYRDSHILDLDYAEDSAAQADANFVLTGAGDIVEIQMTAEEKPFSRDQFDALLELATRGAAELAALQRRALGLDPEK